MVVFKWNNRGKEEGGKIGFSNSNVYIVSKIESIYNSYFFVIVCEVMIDIYIFFFIVCLMFFLF